MHAETWVGIESVWSPMVFFGRLCHNLFNWAVKSPVFGNGHSCHRSTSQTICIAERCGDLEDYESTIGTESWFIAEGHTPPVGPTPACQRLSKSNRLCLSCWVSVKHFNCRLLFIPALTSHLQTVSLDVCNVVNDI
ncbi:hypothetical protein TNCV_2251821 [Trichonephila clavipes]|nr:hypothetical protein TNCV_2251821 [Trichonephila clavipes]